MANCPRVMHPDTGQETVQYDSLSFPLYIGKGNLVSFPNLSAICHWHEDLEFIYIWEGHMEYYVNGEIVRLCPGEGLFVNARQLHYGFSGDGTDCIYLCTLLNPVLLGGNAYLESLVQQVTEHPQWAFVHLRQEMPWQKRILSLLQELYDCYIERADGFELMVEALYFQIIACLYGQRPPVQIGKEERMVNNQLSTLKEMLSVIQYHYMESLTLTEIASAGHLSSSACCRLFHKYLSRTPIEFLTEVRLNQSCILLETTSLSMTQIAVQVGFGGSSYFAERFRRQYGCSPSACRKKHTPSGRKQ